MYISYLYLLIQLYICSQHTSSHSNDAIYKLHTTTEPHCSVPKTLTIKLRPVNSHSHAPNNMPKYKYASLTYIQTTQTIHKNPSRITNHPRRHPFIPVPPVLVPIAQQFVTNQQPNPHDTQILQPTQHPHNTYNTYTTQYNLPYT